MVSGFASLPRSARVVSSIALLGLGIGSAAFAGCSKSECLREDCHTSAPEEGAAGRASNAGAAGQASAGTAGAIASAKKCSANAECPADKGQACVEGTCRIACTSHFDCQGGECTNALDGDGVSGHFCKLSEPQKVGQFYTRCPNGTECDAANHFFCVGAGAEDLDAYCTTDCSEDSTCAPGYACTPIVRAPCDDRCDLKGSPKDPQCIPSDQIGDGKPYQCGSRGVTRNACRPRKFCSPCETDDDCLAVANQVCAKDKSGVKTCTQLCDLQHPSCPWGNAAKCDVWDKDLNRATCAHRFGSCKGTGKSCEPCLKDADCGAQGVCNASSFTGERWCVDFRISCSCGDAADSSGTCAGGGCPETPGGLDMICSDQTPKTPDSGFCVGAYTSTALGASPQTGCWPAR